MNDTLAVIKPEYCIELERTYAFPIEAVWKALTFSNEISDWMGYEASLEQRIGGRIFVDFKSEGSMEGIVCEWEPYKVFAHTWNLSVVKWELQPDGEGTHLRFTNSHAIPEIVVGFAAGWHAFIDHLGPHLAGDSVADRFDELMSVYENRYDQLSVACDS